LLAAIPCGAACGAIAFSRLVLPARRLVLMGPLAVVTCAPLVAFAVRPGLVVAVLLFAASGAASAYQLAANAAFVAAVPPEARGIAFGLVQAVMSVGQGLAVIAAGAAAQLWGPAWVIAGAGIGGCLVAARLAAQWRRSTADPVTSTIAVRRAPA
jgi:predicted MFS family arabinose efflux permease